MSDLYPLTAPSVTATGGELTQISVQLAFNTLAAAVRVFLNQIAVAGPVGPAGGDLSGTYPNPTVAAVHAVSGTLDGVTIGGLVPEPGTFTTLAASSMTLLTALAIAQGGTGATTQAGALANILGASTVPIANGGTNATTAAAARTNLGLGTIATQNANAVAITGGTVDGTSTGSVTPSTGAFTTLSATTPVGVASGGTGRTTLTNHGVLVGEAAAAINQTAAGTTGQMLLGVTGADPAFGNNPTITGGTVDNVSVGATTASTGKFTTLQATGAITPSSTAGVVGTTANDNANAGSVGELSTNTTTGTPLSTGVSSNCATVTLTAGDWDVQGAVTFLPAGGTTVTGLADGISTTSATLGAVNTGATTSFALTFTTGATQVFGTPTLRISVNASTPVYLVANATFGVSTMTANGFIRARRVR